MDKQTLFDLLANNQLDELFYALKNQDGRYSDLVLLESQWNDLRAQQRNGIISTEQANLELSRMRKSLLELIEIASDGRAKIPASPPSNLRRPNYTWLIGTGALVALFIFYQLYTVFAVSSDKTKTPGSDTAPANSTQKTAPRSAQAAKFDLSQAQPITFSPGNLQYERVYSIVKVTQESTGGGKSLITLTIGLNFKGIINDILGTEKFRLVADELPGPLAPSNFLSILVDSKSYEQGDIKFELSDDIRRFSIILEGKEDKKWVISR